MSQSPEAAGVVVALNADEAIVLFEVLSRWISDKAAPSPPAICFESPGECAALSAVLAKLESQLAEPFHANYLELVASARLRLSDGWSASSLRE